MLLTSEKPENASTTEQLQWLYGCAWPFGKASAVVLHSANELASQQFGFLP